MSEIVGYRVQQIVDNGQVVQMTLAEDVQTEPVSQKQLIMENVSKKLDSIVARDLFITSIVDIQVTNTVENGIPNRRLSPSKVVNNQ